MGQFAVIGLGRFGSATSLELMQLGHSVLCVDADGRVVDQMADKLTRAAIADVTDRDTLAELGLTEYDVVLVAIGEHHMQQQKQFRRQHRVLGYPFNRALVIQEGGNAFEDALAHVQPFNSSGST